MGESNGSDDSLLVVALCAAWCRTCGEYRAAFDALACEFGPRARFVWLDIEDDEAVLGPIEVEDFPTLMLSLGGEVRFFGPVLPHVQVGRALVERAMQARTGVVDDTRVKALAGRVQRMG